MARITLVIDDPAIDALGLPAGEAADAYVGLLLQGCVGPGVAGRLVSAAVSGMASDVVALPERPLRAAGRRRAA